MKYTYNLHPVLKPKMENYTREELERLTTLQLRDICVREKIIIVMSQRLDRDYIINAILKYRGKESSKLINVFDSNSLDFVFEELHNNLYLSELFEDTHIQTKILLYKDINITSLDNYEVKGRGLYESNVLLLNDNKEVRGILNLTKLNGRFFLTSNHNLLSKELSPAMYKNYSLGFLSDKDSDSFYDFYHNGKRGKKINCRIKSISELVIAETRESDNTLIIDFGTSNTAAGSYLDEGEHYNRSSSSLEEKINLNKTDKVKFFNEGSGEYIEIMPTLISIKDCRDRANISYRFGYDATINANRNNYNTLQSIFYGIKKWVNNYKKLEEVIDENGNMAVISRQEILRAYLKHIIKIASDQHKCVYKNIHITAPVKQKQQYLQMYKEVLSDYNIEDFAALDEGVAVLYNSISSQIENNNFEEGDEYKALIIDCGGGTTDLTSCRYSIKDNDIAYELGIITTYANGETNFGGNNITYRIFQYIKILFSSYYEYNKLIDTQDIFENSAGDIYRFVDSNGVDSVYESLNNLFEESEKIIPTKFNDYKKVSPEDFIKVRSNFYLLWNMAENIKVSFYRDIGFFKIDFSDYKPEIGSLIKKGKYISSFFINVYKNKSFQLHTDLPEAAITKDDVNILIKPDIYNIVKRFMEPLYLEGALHEFNFIKLTGQTCKIDIFRDALKEFIEGRIIQSSQRGKNLRDFKLICLDGAIKYQNAKKIGLIAPSIKNSIPTLPYTITSFTHTGAEITMLSSLDGVETNNGFISRNIDTKYLELLLKNINNKVLHKYIFNIDTNNFAKTSYDEISSKYGDKIIQDNIDNIVNNEIKIFTYTLHDSWGFFVVAICRIDGALFISKDKYLAFENGEWELNFFDGV